jgi:hypothetical protein
VCQLDKERTGGADISNHFGDRRGERGRTVISSPYKEYCKLQTSPKGRVDGEFATLLPKLEFPTSGRPLRVLASSIVRCRPVSFASGYG